jgi:2-keto-4-pentenoate hydratase/2-oxohepta-3-ene-1,7-dioic acid hydratase in catechol pathway
MRIMRVGDKGAEIPVASADGLVWYDLRPITPTINPAFFASGGPQLARLSLGGGRLDIIDVTGLRVGSPVDSPSVILCVGMNYAAHAAESGSAPPLNPIIFYKAPNTLIGPNDNVEVPSFTSKSDWEVELAVVIARRCFRLASPDEALDYVAGYAIANDVSERYLQLEVSGGQWSKGKSYPTFNPMGPWLVTSDEVSDPRDLRLTSSVNGESRQDSSTRDMIFPVDVLIHEISQFTALEPGDVINTGTPQGVALSGRFPYLTAGDVMDLSITGLGHQSQLVVTR